MSEHRFVVQKAFDAAQNADAKRLEEALVKIRDYEWEVKSGQVDADLGLDVWITEMDVVIQKPVTPAKLAVQAKTYRDTLEVCLAAPNCKTLIVFGLYDGDDANHSAIKAVVEKEPGPLFLPVVLLAAID